MINGENQDRDFWPRVPLDNRREVAMSTGAHKCFKCGRELKGLDVLGKISMIDDSMFEVMELVCEKCGLSFCPQCAGRKGFYASCPKCGGETTPPLIVPPGL